METSIDDCHLNDVPFFFDLVELTVSLKEVMLFSREREKAVVV
jgi:hypothetical protein